MLLLALLPFAGHAARTHDARPNFLIAISDDQSYPHASAYGCRGIETPSFDRIARAGVLFTNAFAPAPGCSPMRAAFLTGRQIWQIEQAGTHASSFPKKFVTFQDRLEAADYAVGFTGKGWAPGNWKVSGRSRNPAGPAFSKRKTKSPKGISRNDYAANFTAFLDRCPEGKPWSFWYGASEPHRPFGKGLGLAAGKKLEDVVVPAFLPDTIEVRADLLDYFYEIEWFDRHFGRMLDELGRRGQLDNTVVIVTSDNGMAFPRAKANVYEYGIHMPLAVSWPAKVAGGRTVDDLVGLIDLTATIYEASAAKPPVAFPIAGTSLLGLLTSGKQGTVEPTRDAVFSGRERHSSSRYHTLGYPQRCIRTREYLYIRNFRPERWPAGTPRRFADASGKRLLREHGGYHDIDPCPTLGYMIAERDKPEIARLLALATAKRPGEELYDVQKDPACLVDLARDPEHQEKVAELSQRLERYLTETGDPRVTAKDGGDVFETYPRYSHLRWFPEPAWAKEHPERVPKQEWLEKRRASQLQKQRRKKH